MDKLDTKVSHFVFSKQLDCDFLKSNFEHNLELARNIFQSFLNDTSNDLAKLKFGVEDNNHEEVSAIVHKIKNNFIYIGASDLNKSLIQIETAAKEKSSELRKLYASFHVELESKLPIIENEYNRLNQFLRD